jgi:YrbI family 3-deoxy-D-manno-octulosonate 8-phosphate phosphatase
VSVICIIPARGGSKRLPGKNLRPLRGRPLVAHSIEHARRARQVDRTLVTTDDDAIADVARAAGAEVVRRPSELATDAATSESALVHVLDSLRDREGYEPQLVVFLQCTSPVRTPEDIDGAIDALRKEAADSLFSATGSRWLLWRRHHDELASLNYDYRRRQRDQDHPDEYRENGSIYVFKPWVLRELGNRLGGRMSIYPMDYWSSFQVDAPEDLELAEWILARTEQAAMRSCLPVRPLLLALDFDGVMTDNRVLVLEDGREAVLCNRGDGLGLERLREVGVPVLVISKERNPVVGARCAKLGLPYMQGVDGKWPLLRRHLAEQRLDPDRVVFVGNDVNDLECLRNVGCGVAVADAHPEILASAAVVLKARGGEGAVREICDLIVDRITSSVGMPA